MEIKIYLLFCALYFFLGVVSIFNFTFKNLPLKLFIALTVLLPITKFTTEFHTNFQISFYYFFFIAPCFLVIKKAVTRKVHIGFLEALILLVPMALLYILGYIFLVDDERSAINILKDLKPFILIPLAFVFMEAYGNRLSQVLTRKFCNRLLLLNLIVCTLFFYAMARYEIHLKLTSDPYYKYEEMRLETLGCYFGIFYFLSLLFRKVKIKWYEFFLCFLPLLYTGNRTLIFSVFCIVGLFFLLRLSFKGVIIFVTTSLLTLGGFLYLVLRADETSPLFRFQKLLSREYIGYALVNRFSPFFDALPRYTTGDYIFGNGLGYTFFIPWFHYRDNVDNYNIYIDNLYLTLYAKFGVFLIILFVAMYLFLKSYLGKTQLWLYFAFILIISVTNAFIYQYNFLWIFLMMALPYYANVKGSQSGLVGVSG